MNTQDPLVLRLARLKSTDELEQGGACLTFVFAKGGMGNYTSDLATHRLLPGDVLVFNGAPGSKITVPDQKGEFLFWTFSICFENMLPLFAGEEISLLHYIAESFKAGKFYPASSPLAEGCHQLLSVVPPQFNLDHRGQLIRIAATILAGEFKEDVSKLTGSVRHEDHLVQVFEKLSASEFINLSVGELASRFSCSRRHLNRLFHQHFGVSVAALRMEMRLIKAISLLRDSESKIIHVAEQCGFNHLGLFNNCFKHRFGTSPSKWRKLRERTVETPPAKNENNSLCPLHCSKICPLIDHPQAPPHAVVARCAVKILNGKKDLADGRRRDLIFGVRPVPNSKCHWPETRASR